jgi:hypothetical protein
LVLGVLIAVPIPLGVKIALLVALALHVGYSNYRLSGKFPRSVTWVRIDAEHGARLMFADGSQLQTRVRGDSLITPWLILLRFDGGRLLQRPSLLLGRDSLAPYQMRRLRVLLRYG